MASLAKSDAMPSGMLDMSRGRRSGLAIGLRPAAAVLDRARARVKAVVIKPFIFDGAIFDGYRISLSRRCKKGTFDGPEESAG